MLYNVIIFRLNTLNESIKIKNKKRLDHACAKTNVQRLSLKSLLSLSVLSIIVDDVVSVYFCTS